MRNSFLFFAFAVLSGVFLLFPSGVAVGLKIALWLDAKLFGIEHDTYEPKTLTGASRLYPGNPSTQGSTVQLQGGDAKFLKGQK